jgi:hypothetical protein
MPSETEINDADPITTSGKILLGAYLRASAFYLSFSWAFTGLSVQVETAATDTTTSKILSAILGSLDSLGDGTVGASGGEFGADYSQSRDREQLCLLALSMIYDFAALGIVIVNGQPTAGQGFSLGGQRGGIMPDLGPRLMPWKL